jgi:hypothetical protein
LDEVIEEIRKLMLGSIEEAVSKENLDRKEPARAAEKMKEKQQRSRGVERQLQEKFWDLGGFQPSWKSHEQELMIFVSMEYDVGASLHLSTRQSIYTHGAHSRKGQMLPSHFASRIKSVIQAFNDDKLEEPSCAFTQDGDKVSIKWLMVGGICIQFGADFHHCNFPIRWVF